MATTKSPTAAASRAAADNVQTDVQSAAALSDEDSFEVPRSLRQPPDSSDEEKEAYRRGDTDVRVQTYEATPTPQKCDEGLLAAFDLGHDPGTRLLEVNFAQHDVLEVTMQQSRVTIRYRSKQQQAAHLSKPAFQIFDRQRASNRAIMERFQRAGAAAAEETKE